MGPRHTKNNVAAMAGSQAGRPWRGATSIGTTSIEAPMQFRMSMRRMSCQ